MIERLKFILAALQKLQDDDRIRHEGNQVFQEAKAELTDVIATYTDPVQVVPAPVYQVMTSEQVEAMVDGVVARLPAADLESIVTAITAQIESSDLAVIDAIASSRADVLAAIVPA